MENDLDKLTLNNFLRPYPYLPTKNTLSQNSLSGILIEEALLSSKVLFDISPPAKSIMHVTDPFSLSESEEKKKILSFSCVATKKTGNLGSSDNIKKEIVDFQGTASSNLDVPDKNDAFYPDPTDF